MDEQFEFLRSVVERLDAAGIPYMLTGSLALAVWARPRMTRDVDLVIEADVEAIRRLVEAFAPDCYVSEDAAISAAVDRSMFKVIHLSSLLKADFILRRDDAFERRKFERRRVVDMDGLLVAVISAEDLILSKLQWSRLSQSARQLDDVRLLLRDASGLDRSYLEEWATALHLVSALNAAETT
jgi:predicted nucleotidyltransferase